MSLRDASSLEMVPATEPLRWYVNEGREPSPGAEADLRREVEQAQRFFAQPDRAEEALGGMTGEVEPVFLPATQHGQVVVVSAKWNLEEAVLKLRLAVFGLAADQDLVARGWRFETPDGDEGHDHSLHHLQPINSLFGPASEQLLPWHFEGHCEKEPTFPLPAKETQDLVAVMLLSLYGQGELRAVSGRNGNVLDASLTRILTGAGAL